LVLVGEGHGETTALPLLVQKVLLDREAGRRLPLDKNLLRFLASNVFRWDKAANRQDYKEWLREIAIAGRRSEGGAVLAVYDGDFKLFPPGITFHLLRLHCSKVAGSCGCRVRCRKDFLPCGGLCLRGIRNLANRRNREPDWPSTEGRKTRPALGHSSAPRRSRVARKGVDGKALSSLPANSRSGGVNRIAGFGLRPAQATSILPKIRARH
jgi:hypothetical protein